MPPANFWLGCRAAGPPAEFGYTGMGEGASVGATTAGLAAAAGVPQLGVVLA